MRKSALTLLVVVQSLATGQTITGFGNSPSDFTILESTFSTTTQAATNLFVSGPDNTSLISGVLTTPVFLDATETPFESWRLNLTGSRTSTQTGTFSIELFDESFNSIKYNANWSGFAPVASTQTMTYASSSGTFNGTVQYLIISTGGTGDTMNFTFDNLSAQPIPEPSVFMTITAFGVLGYTLLNRRRSTNQTVS